MSPRPDSLSLATKVAIVTGSGRENGIGAGIALALAKAGARVVVNYISESTAPRAAEVVAKIEAEAGQGSVILVQADVTTLQGTRTLVDETLAQFSVDHIDIIVNNAGVVDTGPLLSASQEAITKVFEVNIFGPIYLMQAAEPHMPRGGRIINIGTVISKLGIKGGALYAASKAAMATLSYTMAQELGHRRGITINTIAPGPVITDAFDPAVPPEMLQLKDYLVSITRAEDRPGTVEDIADVVLFVASEKSRWITGQWISVSGGITGV